tara:strand:- start:1932 stop:2309 length:378 start_codon:yes stop_codon:yes gene_type:complete
MLQKIKSMKLGLVTLIISSSTLICCALPAIFVTLGAGATLASLTNIFPQLIIISQYKVLISSITLIILLVAGVMIKKSDAMPCPVDPNLKTICLKTRKNSKILYYLSVIIFASASVFTYLVPLYL